jgi:hypothetical protein
MARQIRTVRDGETVSLALHSVAGGRDPWIVEAVLISREGTGAEERVHLKDKNDPREAVWDIYRHKGHWAWGPTGARVTVHDPNAKPRKPRTVRPKVEAPAAAPANSKNVAKTDTKPVAKRRGRPRKNPVPATATA